MRALLLAGVALAAPLFLAGTANATLQMCVAEDGGLFTCSATSNTGALTFSPTETNFANITISSTGVPIESSPDLATTDLNADTLTGFIGTHTLDIEVFQTGLVPVNASLQSTFTVNGLIGATQFPGPSTLQDFTGGSGTSLGTLLHSDAFGTVSNATTKEGPTSVAGVTSDAQEFLITFNQAGQSVTDTIQTVGVVATPEPASLSLLGVALIGLGMVRGLRPPGDRRSPRV